MTYRLLLLVTGAAAVDHEFVWTNDVGPDTFYPDEADTVKWTYDKEFHDIWLLKDRTAYVSTPRRANRQPTRSPLAGFLQLHGRREA